MPQLAALYKKYVDQGFHIVGIEGQNSAKEAIDTLCKEKGVGYQITIQSELKGANVTGIPHGFLFSADGKLVSEELRGKALDDKVKELVAESAAAMAGPGPYVKLANFAAQVKTGQGLGTVLKMLTTKKASKDATEAAEAQMMYDSLHGAGQAMLDRAVAKKDEDAVESLTKLDKLAMQFAGDEIGTNPRKESDTMKKDPKVKKEVEASLIWKKIEDIDAHLKPFQRSLDHANEGFRKQNQVAIMNIVGGCKMLVDKYHDTHSAEKAKELMGQFK